MSITPGIKIKGPDGQTYITGQRGRVPAWVESNLKYRVLLAKADHPDAKVLINDETEQIYVVGQRGRVPAWVLSHPDYVPATSNEDNTEAEEKPVETPVVAETQEKATPVETTPVKTAPVETVTVREAVKQEGNVYTFSDKQVPVSTVQTDETGEVDLDANTLNMYADRVDAAITDYNKQEPDYFAKKELHAKSRTFLKLFATKVLGLEDDKFEVRSNLAGDDVSGEITLHTDSLYVQISCGSHLPILFRKCHGRTDYTGETNNWACSARKLLDIHRNGL